MTRKDLIMKEYDMAYDNYKLTFQHSMDAVKFYVTIISIFLIGFALKGDLPLEELKGNNLVLIVITILILCGILCLLLQYRIILKRAICIKRLNYLREELFIDVDKEFYDKYISLSGYKRVIESNRKSINGISDFAPFIFIGIITLSLLVTLLLLIMRFSMIECQ
jgi:hypothetical protein